MNAEKHHQTISMSLVDYGESSDAESEASLPTATVTPAPIRTSVPAQVDAESTSDQPTETAGIPECNPSLQNKVNQWMEIYVKSEGRQSLNAVLGQNRVLRNPRIGDRVREFMGVKALSVHGEYATLLNRDQEKLPASAFYDQLDLKQKEMHQPGALASESIQFVGAGGLQRSQQKW